MRGKITKRSVDALKLAAGKEVTLWDAEVKGFGVRIRPGGTKTYIVRYRPGLGGRSAPLRTFTIGAHGSPWTPEKARARAKLILGKVADGNDPAAERSAGREAPTVEDLCQRFLDEHVDAKRKRRTGTEYRRLVEQFIKPALGKRLVAAVSRDDIARLHHAQKATPYQANRLLSVVSKMMNLAERWRMRPDGSNPCRHLDRYEERSRERMLSSDELAALGEALAAYDGWPYAAAAIKLLIFTGARLSEILGLRWEWIDFERGEARLPDSKTGAKTLHLAPPALEILSTLMKIEGNPFVIVGAGKGAALVNLEKPWRCVRDRATVFLWSKGADRAVSALISSLAEKLGRQPTAPECILAAKVSDIGLTGGLLDVRLHDLRHAFASVGAASGMGLPIIGALLGHTQVATTQRYAHLASDPLKAAAAAVAGKLDGAMRGKIAEIRKLER